MTKLFLVLSFLYITPNIFGQKDSSHLFTEYVISVNKMMMYDEYLVDKHGFGISGTHPFKLSNKLDLVSGIDFQIVSFINVQVASSHFITYSNITYRMPSVAVPLSVRFHTIGKIKYFASTGFCVAINLGMFSKGTEVINSPGKYSKNEIKLRVPVTTFGFGPFENIGCMIPIGNKYLLLKLEYNYWLNALDVDYSFDFVNRFILLGVGIKY